MPLRSQIEDVFRSEGRTVIATLIRILGGDFELAEDALQDAFEAALASWPAGGVPDNPGAWLLTTARRKGIDRLRRSDTAQRAQPELAALAEVERDAEVDVDVVDSQIRDDQLRLIFTCCHPALDLHARVALTLRTLGGLTTEEIASAFLVPKETMAQRLVRAKAKIRKARIPYSVPGKDALPERIDGVLAVVYLIFNEAYLATRGHELVRSDLAAEANRLGHELCKLLPDEPEVCGLTALMLLHDSRRNARLSGDGALVILEEQDRSAWDHEQIEHGKRLLDDAIARGRPGPYQLQAAIAALHAEATTSEDTDWAQITLLYERLVQFSPTPVVRLNHAVAFAMAHGVEEGLARIEAMTNEPVLQNYLAFHAARADLLRRLDRREEALAAYHRALELADTEPVRKYLGRRVQELS